VTAHGPSLLEVVKGDPSDEEVAALVVVMLALAEAAGSMTDDPACCTRSRWGRGTAAARSWTLGSPWAMSARAT
jgi:hypothetical protein